MRTLSCKLAANRRAAEGIYLATLDAPEIAKAASPGQFVHVSFSVETGSLLRRPFSIHAVEGDKIHILYRVVGAATFAMSHMRGGVKLDVLGPLGKPFNAPKSGPVILLGGGMGIAPLLFLAQKLSGKLDMKAIVAAKTADGLARLAQLRKTGAQVLLCTEDGSRGKRGLATEILEAELQKCEGKATVFACGPAGMLKRAAQICAKAGAPCQVSLEEHMACGIGVCLCCPVPVNSGGYKSVCKDGPVFDAREVAWQALK
jgi:dihydroorotate dehydrogenase electron transfer subunit